MLLADLNARFGGSESSMVLAIATFLDPRFKKNAFQSANNYSRVKELEGSGKCRSDQVVRWSRSVYHGGSGNGSLPRKKNMVQPWLKNHGSTMVFWVW